MGMVILTGTDMGTGTNIRTKMIMVMVTVTTTAMATATMTSMYIVTETRARTRMTDSTGIQPTSITLPDTTMLMMITRRNNTITITKDTNIVTGLIPWESRC
jgi:hypothetical protein